VHKTPFASGFSCSACGFSYPVVNETPVLINDANSVFRISDFMAREGAYGGASAYGGSLDRTVGLKAFYRRLVYKLSESAIPVRDFDANRAVAQIRNQDSSARILVIGAGETAFDGNTINTDVAFGKHVTCIADAHDLPFQDDSFDACVACAVLEHVVDPYRCVAEISRVLVRGGYVYAETPFMQPVHMREYDFTRFTFLGHRRLFRNYDEVASGLCGATGISSAHIVRATLASLSDRPALKRYLKLLGLVGGYPFRWLDYVSHKNLSAYDAASAFYFFGKLRESPISDRDILKAYRGS
jgi:SAM-dependent methyltransferase